MVDLRAPVSLSRNTEAFRVRGYRGIALFALGNAPKDIRAILEEIVSGYGSGLIKLVTWADQPAVLQHPVSHGARVRIPPAEAMSPGRRLLSYPCWPRSDFRRHSRRRPYE